VKALGQRDRTLDAESISVNVDVIDLDLPVRTLDEVVADTFRGRCCAKREKDYEKRP
jgi:hypothetical protein